MKCVVRIILIFSPITVQADVVFDGTLGNRTTLAGPEYIVNAE